MINYDIDLPTLHSIYYNYGGQHNSETELYEYLDPFIPDEYREEFENLEKEGTDIAVGCVERIENGEDYDAVTKEVASSLEYAKYNYHKKQFLIKCGMIELRDGLKDPEQESGMEV